MKKYFYFLLVFISVTLFVSCNNQNNNKQKTENGIAVLVFEKTSHNFGAINEGEKVIYSFQFTNKGNVDLQLTSVGTSCGCTASEYPLEPIKPEESGKIKITFNSAHRLGMQHKKITIRANTNPEFSNLSIYAQVIDKNSEN